ncbi:hypothetical protein [Pseudoxanthomonas sp. UTMC 1351]|uniref:hypothetical protein n=1 Tax=Pseudoxanthomonas sp. UTMC 1351 TaxID=2695853 RepID=UPI0034CD5DFC
MSALKQHQASCARKQAHGHRQAEQELREAAVAARLSGQHALEMAALTPENGLSRQALYERLRQLSEARAQVAETALESGRLDEQAQARAQQAQQAQAQGLLLERKQRKLDHWAKQMHRIARARLQRRSQEHTQEEHACRLSHL